MRPAAAAAGTSRDLDDLHQRRKGAGHDRDDDHRCERGRRERELQPSHQRRHLPHHPPAGRPHDRRRPLRCRRSSGEGPTTVTLTARSRSREHLCRHYPPAGRSHSRAARRTARLELLATRQAPETVAAGASTNRWVSRRETVDSRPRRRPAGAAALKSGLTARGTLGASSRRRGGLTPASLRRTASGSVRSCATRLSSSSSLAARAWLAGAHRTLDGFLERSRRAALPRSSPRLVRVGARRPLCVDELLDYRSRRPLLLFDTDHWESYEEPTLRGAPAPGRERDPVPAPERPRA